MLINLPDNTKLAITKALRNGCSTNRIARQFHISVHYARCCRNAFCPDLVKPKAVQSCAAVYRQYCDLRYDIPSIRDICKHLGITNNTLALSRFYYESEPEPWLLKFNADHNIKTERPVLCEPAVAKESGFVSKIKLSELPGEVVTIPELKISGQDLELPPVSAAAASGRTEVKVQVKGSKISFAVDNAALVPTVIGIIKGLYV